MLRGVHRLQVAHADPEADLEDAIERDLLRARIELPREVPGRRRHLAVEQKLHRRERLPLIEQPAAGRERLPGEGRDHRRLVGLLQRRVEARHARVAVVA